MVDDTVSAQPVVVGGHFMSSVVVGDCWYLSSFAMWKDKKECIFWAHLPTLISSATSAHTSTASEHVSEILFQFCLRVCNLDCELIVNDQLINRYCGLID